MNKRESTAQETDGVDETAWEKAAVWRKRLEVGQKRTESRQSRWKARSHGRREEGVSGKHGRGGRAAVLYERTLLTVARAPNCFSAT